MEENVSTPDSWDNGMGVTFDDYVNLEEKWRFAEIFQIKLFAEVNRSR